jgi:hypothetical protein
MQQYKGLTVSRESSNLAATIIDVAIGYESQNPDLNTLYLQYINSGNDGEQDLFANSQILIISNPEQGVETIAVDVPSTRFSNSDSVVILAQFEIQNTSGGSDFAAGEFETGGTVDGVLSGGTLEIVSHDDNVKDGYRVIKVKPLTSQLIIANTDSWTFTRGETITDTTVSPTAEAVFVEWAGGGATASLVTSATGQVRSVNVVDKGAGYYVDPYVAISTSTATESDVNTLSLIPRRYVAKVEVAGDAYTNPVGSSYGMSVSDGTIFQKGYFTKVSSQFRIISKYSNTQSDIQVGFSTIEAVSNSSIDPNLTDNAAGFLNQNAPGADRLTLTPVLTVYNTVESVEDDDFFGIWKFSEGKVVQENSKTAFSDIGDEMALRTFEESGNYVIDMFQINTRSTVDIANSAQFFDYIIDPGHAYINGYRVKTNRNNVIGVEKAIETKSMTNSYIDLEYGNFLLVDDYAGTVDFKLGDEIELYSLEQNACSEYSDGTIVDTNSQIGKAKVRSFVYDGGGQPGSPSARYRLYLFDIIMNPGKNFENCKSVYYSNGTRTASADIILEAKSGASNKQVAVIQNPQFNTLIMNSKLPMAIANTITYDYRTHVKQVPVQVTGVGTVTAADTFYYTGVLTTSQEQELIVVPEEHIYFSANLTGTFASQTGNTITGSGTSFATQLKNNDWIYMNDGADEVWLRVVSVLSDTTLLIDTTQGTATAIAGSSGIQRIFPKNIPIDMTRSGITANVIGNFLNLNLPATNAVANVSVTYNERIVNTGLKEKTVTRGVFAKIDISTHPEGVNGPWCLGLSDAFRLSAVYDGDSTSDALITDNFYIDNNQTENYVGLSYLYKKNRSYTVGSSDVLLVKFDILSSDPGCKTVSSYPLSDNQSLADMITDGTVLNTLEMPEFTGRTGRYYDVRECFDFRPSFANTVAVVQAAASAPTNPAEANNNTPFSSSYTDLKFPVPESDIFANFSYYTPRKDTIILNSDGTFDVRKGQEILKGDTDPNTLILFGVNVTPYPSLPAVLSKEMIEILNTRVGTDSDINNREDIFRINTVSVEEQTQAYTMHEISQLERRIQALEYYMNLSETEDQVRNAKLTSSIDSTLERFKFGFFVDNFVDGGYTDLNSKEHTARVYENALAPELESIVLEMRTAAFASRFNDGKRITFPWTSKKVISQTNATNGPVIVPPPAPPPPPVIPNIPPPPILPPPPVVVPTTKRVCKLFNQKSSRFSGVSELEERQVFEGNIIKLSSNTDANGQLIQIKFNVFGGRDRIVVYQGPTDNPSVSGVVLANTSNMTVGGSSFPKLRALTTAEKTELRNSGYGTFGADFTRSSHPIYGANYWMVNSGIIEIEYDITKGQYLEVRDYKASPMHKYVVCWPGSSEQITSVVSPPSVQVPTNPIPITYIIPSSIRIPSIPPVIPKPAPVVTKPIVPTCTSLPAPKIDVIADVKPIAVVSASTPLPVVVAPPLKPASPPAPPPPTTVIVPGFGSITIPVYTMPPVVPAPEITASPIEVITQTSKIDTVAIKTTTGSGTYDHIGSMLQKH